MGSPLHLFTNFPIGSGWRIASLATKTATDGSQPKVMKREDRNADPLLKKSAQSTHQPVATTPQYVAKAVPARLKDDRSWSAGMSSAEEVCRLDTAIFAAVKQPVTTLLTQLLDAHPHAGPVSADSSAGAAIRRFFRQVASWFNSDAVAWQGKQAVILLNEAARIGNAEAIRILLDRGMDLQKDAAVIKEALRIAVRSGNAHAAGVLLREVLRDEPSYVKNPELTIEAARAEHTNVLTFLVDEGMALPAQSARLRSISHGADLAHQALLDAVAEKFREFTSKGEVRPDMREYLMDKGMYRVLADLVVDAAMLAASSTSWNQPNVNRKLLFANALDESAIKQKDLVQRARDASGNPDLFDKLLSPQLGMLIAYYEFAPVQDRLFPLSVL